MVAVVGLAGCVVGPDYHAAATGAPAAWISPAAVGVTDRAGAPSSWWASFNDGELDSLIERAVRSNLDLRVAEARLRQARAVRGGSAADFAPADRRLRIRPAPAAEPESTLHSGAAAAAELPLRVQRLPSRLRRLVGTRSVWRQAPRARSGHGGLARSDRGAQRCDGEPAGRGRSELCRIARQPAAPGDRASQPRAAAGSAGTHSRPLSRRRRDRAGRHAAAALLAARAGGDSAARNRRCARPCTRLLYCSAGSPANWSTELSPAPACRRCRRVPIGLPSDLLRRRPDVRRAERQLAAETARIGVAKSDWFPKISLTGDAGVESVSLEQLVRPGSRFWSIGPSVQWNALDFGRVRAEVRAQTAVQEAALATYQKAVLVSLQEAENAIVPMRRSRIGTARSPRGGRESPLAGLGRRPVCRTDA